MNKIKFIIIIVILFIVHNSCYANSYVYWQTVKTLYNQYSTGDYQRNWGAGAGNEHLIINYVHSPTSRTKHWIGTELSENSYNHVYDTSDENVDSGVGSLLEFYSTGQTATNVDYIFSQAGSNKTVRTITVLSIPDVTTFGTGNNNNYPSFDWMFLGYPELVLGSEWAGWLLNWTNGQIYWGGYGVEVIDVLGDMPSTVPCEFLGTCPSPTPTPSPVPTPNPYPMPSATFIPDVITSTGTGTVTSEGTFSYDEVTGMGTITTTSNISITVDTTEEKEYVDIPSEIYEIDENYEEITSNIPLSGGGDAASYTDAVSDYIGVADGVVDDVSGSAFQPVVNWILDTVFLHPMMDFFGDISFDVHDALCSVEWEFQGYTIAFSFCDLESSLLILRYVIIGVSYVYGILIVIKGD